MAKTSTLTIKIVSDAKQAAAGFSDAEAKVGRFQSGLDKASVAAGGLLAGVGAIAKGAFDAASDLQQSTGAINSVFGDWALDIEQSAQAAAGAVGLSTSAYEDLAAVIGSQLKGAGMDIGDVTTKTQDLVAKGADLAATFGGTTADAVAALSSALKGEFDPMERYGVSLKQSDLNARLAAEGNDKLTGAALKTATANAALAIITEQTASSAGSFARESDTAAGAQARASAQFANAKAVLGEQLLPVVARGAELLASFAGWASENAGTVQILAGVLAGLAATVLVVNGAVKAYELATKIAAAAQWIWNAAMSANPISLVVLAVAALVAGVILAYNKVDWFRDAVQAAGRAMASAFDKFKDALTWISDKLGGISSVAKGVGSVLGGLFGAPSTAPAGGVVGAAGVFGAARTAAASPLRSLSSSAGGGSGPSTAGGGLTRAAAPSVTINVSGALDPVAVARQLKGMLRDLGVAEGMTVARAL